MPTVQRLCPAAPLETVHCAQAKTDLSRLPIALDPDACVKALERLIVELLDTFFQLGTRGRYRGNLSLPKIAGDLMGMVGLCHRCNLFTLGCR